MINAIIGGVLIGCAVSIMLLFNGRVTGISGIISGLLKPIKGDSFWRFLFVLGLLSGGGILKIYFPESFSNTTNSPLSDYIIGGFLVGFGTLLGNGCTSGHGVCGISRLSFRSITATMIFILFGILSVFVLRTLRGGV
jgi:uncharacterized membrane protein YedE/YeeE